MEEITCRCQILKAIRDIYIHIYIYEILYIIYLLYTVAMESAGD